MLVFLLITIKVVNLIYERPVNSLLAKIIAISLYDYVTVRIFGLL